MRRSNTGYRWSNKIPALAFDIGRSTAVIGGAETITVGSGGVPSTRQIFLILGENSGSGSASVTDSAGNVYAIDTATSNVAIGVYIFRSRTGKQLNSGDTIVATL